MLSLMIVPSDQAQLHMINAESDMVTEELQELLQKYESIFEVSKGLSLSDDISLYSS